MSKWFARTLLAIVLANIYNFEYIFLNLRDFHKQHQIIFIIEIIIKMKGKYSYNPENSGHPELSPRSGSSLLIKWEVRVEKKNSLIALIIRIRWSIMKQL